MGWNEDATLLRRNSWENRDTLLDALLLHDCDYRKVVEAGIRIVGWEVAQFILAALYDDEAMLRMTAGA